jgi:hypothetical protein
METSALPPNPNVPTPKEQSQLALAYEHLFPGNSFNSLPYFNPLNVPRLAKTMLWDIETRETRFAKAARSGFGFAERVDFSFLDKLSMESEMEGIKPSPEKIAYGTVSDLLREGERLSGIALKEIKSNPAMEKGINSVVMSAFDKNAQSSEIATGKIIGVVDRAGSPKGYILYREGNRPPKGPKDGIKDVKGVSGKDLIPVPSQI